jgi:hypothetical protein
MPWTQVGSVNVGINWSYTQPVEGELFRLNHTGAVINDEFLVAQVYVENSLYTFSDIRFLHFHGSEVIKFEDLALATERRLAFKKNRRQESLEEVLRRIVSPTFLRFDRRLVYPQSFGWEISVEKNEAMVAGRNLGTYTTCTNNKLILAANTSTSIVSANSNRAYLLIQNLSETRVTFAIGEPPAVLNSGVVLERTGSYFEILQNNLFRGQVFAIASEAVELSIVECNF